MAGIQPEDIAKTYPEAIAIVEMAETVWSGESHIRRVDFAPTGRLKAELKKLLGKEWDGLYGWC